MREKLTRQGTLPPDKVILEALRRTSRNAKKTAAADVQESKRTTEESGVEKKRRQAQMAAAANVRKSKRTTEESDVEK